ncbi:MAG: polysaccharide biosynthesis/export family protein [Bacteroidales bacterium]|nr:polysaccharide biosynthesis/export family protein [Bacteroidales bacterium]
MNKHLLPLIALLMLLASCATQKKISYFQDISNDSQSTEQTVTLAPEIRLRPEDKISIIVNSKDPELSALFNLPYTARVLGQTGENVSNNTNQGTSGYIVKGDGTIDFPVLGTIQVAGMTRDEVSAYIKQQLISQNLVNDPVVTVEYVNLQFSVMGEVKAPGSYKITRDRITLLDAISQAGDMTIYGKRDNVLILRPDSIGKLSAYHVDMRSFNDVVSSPAYYIHQNDYIYVEPNKKRANESTVNGNTVQSASFWISIVSLLASLASTTTLILTRAK